MTHSDYQCNEQMLFGGNNVDEVCYKKSQQKVRRYLPEYLPFAVCNLTLECDLQDRQSRTFRQMSAARIMCSLGKSAASCKAAMARAFPRSVKYAPRVVQVSKQPAYEQATGRKSHFHDKQP